MPGETNIDLPKREDDSPQHITEKTDKKPSHTTRNEKFVWIQILRFVLKIAHDDSVYDKCSDK